MDLVFDIETDDIAATVIHCIVCQDPESGEIFKFKPDQIAAGCKFLADADTLIGHNIVGFDIPVIKKLTGVDR
jgi:DNA polymerase-1